MKHKRVKFMKSMKKSSWILTVSKNKINKGNTEATSNKNTKKSANQEQLVHYFPVFLKNQCLRRNVLIESLRMTRFPRWEYWKLKLVNKRCTRLLKSGEIFEIDIENRFREPSVCMVAHGENSLMSVGTCRSWFRTC